MANNWKETTLGEFSPFAYGKGLPSKKRNQDGNVKVYGSNGVVGNHDEFLINNAGIVIGRKGTVGAVHFSEAPFWPIDTTFYIKDEPEKRDLRFTYFLLKTLGLEHMNADSAVPGLNRDAAHARKIRIPDLSEQKQIAHILGSLDDKIELNRRMNETLEQMARAIFKSWFVDFDPVKAKAEGKKPAGMNAETAKFFPDSFEDSELGKIPKGWKIGKLGDLCDVQGGFAYKSDDFIEKGHAVVKIKNLQDDRTVDLFNTQFVPPELAFSTKDFMLDDGDLVIAMTGATVGKFGIIVNHRKHKPVLNQRVGKFIALDKHGGIPWFIYCMLLQEETMSQIVSIADGSAQPNISAKGIKSASCIVPSDDVILAFNRKVEALFQKMMLNYKQSRTLASIRDALLPKLLSGRIRLQCRT